MTLDFYTDLRRRAFHAGLVLAVGWIFVGVAYGYFSRGDSSAWLAAIAAVVAFLAALRIYPRFTLVRMDPDETMVEFMERMKDDHADEGEPPRVTVEKDDT